MDADHFPAGLLTATTFRGTARHVFVLRELLARRRAARARFGAGLAYECGKRPAASHNLRGRGAEFGTILTRSQCRQMFFVTRLHLMSTMGCARIAPPLTIRTCLRTSLHGGIRLRMQRFPIVARRRQFAAQRSHRQSRQPSHSEFSSSDHDRSPGAIAHRTMNNGSRR